MNYDLIKYLIYFLLNIACLIAAPTLIIGKVYFLIYALVSILMIFVGHINLVIAPVLYVSYKIYKKIKSVNDNNYLNDQVKEVETIGIDYYNSIRCTIINFLTDRVELGDNLQSIKANLKFTFFLKHFVYPRIYINRMYSFYLMTFLSLFILVSIFCIALSSSSYQLDDFYILTDTILIPSYCYQPRITLYLENETITYNKHWSFMSQEINYDAYFTKCSSYCGPLKVTCNIALNDNEDVASPVIFFSLLYLCLLIQCLFLNKLNYYTIGLTFFKLDREHSSS